MGDDFGVCFGAKDVSAFFEFGASFSMQYTNLLKAPGITLFLFFSSPFNAFLTTNSAGLEESFPVKP